MNLFKSKLRRTATVVGGSFLGLVGVAAMAAPALACYTEFKPVSSCVNADGTWVVNWQVHGDLPDIPGDITDVQVTPQDSKLTGIVIGPLPAKGDHLDGVQTLSGDAEYAQIAVSGHWVVNNGQSNEQDIAATRESEKVYKPTEKCTPTPVESSSAPAPVDSSSAPAPSESSSPSASPSPSASVPVTAPQFVYTDTCTTFTVGIQVPSDWPQDITVTFTPSTGTAKTIVGKRGKTTTVDFPGSTGLKVKAAPKGYEDETTTLTYKVPANCSSSSAAASGGLAVTGSAAAPIGGGAVVLLLIGGVLFFLARRRKVKFTA